MVVHRKDVAVLAGVSPAVVSYVLNGGPRGVAPETRARVLAAIEHLDYRPHGVARIGGSRHFEPVLCRTRARGRGGGLRCGLHLAGRQCDRKPGTSNDL